MSAARFMLGVVLTGVYIALGLGPWQSIVALVASSIGFGLVYEFTGDKS